MIETDYIIKSLEDYSIEDKIAHFDKMYSFAKECWDEYIKDHKQYAYEELMDLLIVNKNQDERLQFYRTLNKRHYE